MPGQRAAGGGTSGPAGMLVDIPPARSPLLQPVTSSTRTSRTGSLSSPRAHGHGHGLPTIPQDDILDELEFVPANGTVYTEEPEGEEEDEVVAGEDELEDWSLEDGHIVGVPSANVKLSAKQFTTARFAQQLLELFRDDLRIPGWAELPYDLPASVLHIHKVSGALTNAVFFVSIPEGHFDISPEPSRATPSSLIDTAFQLSGGRSTPTKSSSFEEKDVPISAPTLLLRVYGPSSGSLISRRTELHILHTLSSHYQIGPAVLGTFVNGRVEEYFHSRALTKEEMRVPRISRWIGRRMRELHSVDLERMEIPDGPPSRTPSTTRTNSAGEPARPPLDVSRRYSSGGSIYSSSSNQSVFSFGTSYASSNASTASLATLNTEAAPLSPVVLPTKSPMLTPYRGLSEGPASNKRRSRASISTKGKKLKDKVGVWENITRWTREARNVLSKLDDLTATPGFDEYLEFSKRRTERRRARGNDYNPPLSSVDLVMAMRADFNLPAFEQEVKQYRTFVKEWEQKQGKSKRVFAHNDTQYGNLLLLTPEKDEDEQAFEAAIQAPHQRIIVVDFEYAAANARGYDIANHFVEWQADYHHPTLSHSLSSHLAYPDETERARFLSAYLGADGGYDGDDDDGRELALVRSEDPRLTRLEDEVAVWTPASHASWSVWGIVQAKEELEERIKGWKGEIERLANDEESLAAHFSRVAKVDDRKDDAAARDEDAGAPLTRGKSGEGMVTDEDGTVHESEFDYLGYALEKMDMFRNDSAKLGAILPNKTAHRPTAPED